MAFFIPLCSLAARQETTAFRQRSGPESPQSVPVLLQPGSLLAVAELIRGGANPSLAPEGAREGRTSRVGVLVRMGECPLAGESWERGKALRASARLFAPRVPPSCSWGARGAVMRRSGARPGFACWDLATVRWSSGRVKPSRGKSLGLSWPRRSGAGDDGNLVALGMASPVCPACSRWPCLTCLAHLCGLWEGIHPTLCRRYHLGSAP